MKKRLGHPHLLLSELYLSLTVATVVVAMIMAGTSVALADKTDTATNSADEKLKAAVVESESRVGPLEAWQKKIFDEEVVPQYQFFVKDFKASAQGVSVDVDTDSIKKYLSFYGPKTLGRGNAPSELKFLMFLKSEPSCAKCTQAIPEVKKMLRSRLESRGLTPVWSSSNTLSGENGAEGADDSVQTLATLKGKNLDNKLQAMAREKNAAGAAIIQLQVAPVDSIDSAHADEKRYRIHTFVSVRAQATPASAPLAPQVGPSPVAGVLPPAVKAAPTVEAKLEEQVEIQENDSLDGAVSRLLANAMIHIGPELEQAKATAQVTHSDDDKEIAIEVTGINDFAQYSQLKAKILSGPKELTGAEEREISRGGAVFGLHPARTTLTAQDLKKVLEGMPIEPGRLKVLEVADRRIKVDIK